MFIKRLTLENFRNWSKLDWQPAPGLNVLTGANAQGKSNLLEALFFLATGKSFRTFRDGELARFGAGAFAVGGRIVKASGETTLVLRWEAARGKTLTLDHTEHPRLAELFGEVTAVIFSPEDLALVKGSPEVRRQALNLLLLQTSRAYYHHLREYNRALSQRNTWLKRLLPTAGSELALAVWDDALAVHGAELMLRRRAALADLTEWAGERHRELTGGTPLDIAYLPSVPLTPGATLKEAQSAIAEALAARRREEIHRGVTLSGPQRDEVRFLIEERDLRVYGSQGEQRTAALAWKLGEVEYIRARTGEAPLLLLDDVFSELDPERRACLTRYAGQANQTFITSTDEAEVQRLAGATAWRITSGTLSPF